MKKITSSSVPDFMSKVVRAFLFEVKAVDCNRPQYLVQRYSSEVIQQITVPHRTRKKELEYELNKYKK